jgi:hypothetical protein
MQATQPAASEETAPTAGPMEGGESAHPAEGAPITGTFGENRGDHAHGGLDFGVPSNTSILAMAPGTVSQVVTDGQGGGYGNFVIVDHGNGISTRYAHLNSVGVQVGARVGAGAPLGLSGSTGKSSGPHLHFEVMQNGKQVDPSPYLAGGGAILGKAGAEGGTTAEPLSFEEIASAQLQNVLDFIAGEDPEIAARTKPGKGKQSATVGDSPEAWVREAMRITGVGEDWFEPLMKRMMQESGGNPAAQNDWDSNAKAGTPSRGLFQTIDSTFKKYKVEGFDDIWNPVHNAVAAINYMKARYGSVHNLPKGGY